MNAEIRVGFCVIGMGRFFTVMRLFSFPPSALPASGKECHVNRIIPVKAFGKGRLCRLITTEAAERCCQDAQRA
ncbi:MAG: hypothetical protein ACLTXL_13955 [Clostridia bacterium]